MRRELIELEAEAVRDGRGGGGGGKARQQAAGAAAAPAGSVALGVSAAAATAEKSIARKRSTSTLRARGRSASVVSNKSDKLGTHSIGSGEVVGLLSPLSAAMAITSSAQTSSKSSNAFMSPSPSPSPSSSSSSSKDRHKAKKAEKRRKSSATSTTGDLPSTSAAALAVPTEDGSLRASTHRSMPSDGIGYTTDQPATLTESLVSPRTSSLGLSVMTQGTAECAWDPTSVPLPDSPSLEAARLDFGVNVADSTDELPSSTRHHELLPAFPPADEDAAGSATIRVSSASRNGTRRNSSRKSTLPVGAPGWNRDEDTTSSSAAPPSPQPSIASLTSSSRSPSKINNGGGGHDLLVASTRERDRLAAEVSRLQRAAQSAKDKERAASKQAQRSKEDASKAFNECVQAREDIVRARTDADRALAREAAMAREVNDLKRELYMRDMREQDARRREAEVRSHPG